jgi:thioredoxin reductase (NADPH)
VGVIDVAVVGGGVAALTAALFAARQGLACLVMMPGVPGGQLMNVERVDDFPGFPQGIAGYDLGPALQEQAAEAGAEFRLGEVGSLTKHGDLWLVDDVEARVAIVATGSSPRRLGVPGEERLTGRGVSHCASCDGPLFRGKRVAVVGGGDSAFQEALTAAGFASEVFLIHRGAPRAQQIYSSRVESAANVSLRQGVVAEIVGDGEVTGVRLADSADLHVAGVFVYVGMAPNTPLLRELVALDADDRVATDSWMRAGPPGLFAAGDIRADFPGQAINAASDGATAAIGAFRHLRRAAAV